MTVKNSSILGLKLVILIFHSSLLLAVNTQCCLEFTENSCIRCPAGMHLYRSNCIYDIDGCLEYSLGFDCSSCKSNYQLLGGICIHTRFSPSVSNSSNFTVFLQSTLKPDAVMQSAQQELEAEGQLWVDWYNFTLISNKTYMNKNSLLRNALNLMNLTVGNPKLQYIFTSQAQLNTSKLLLYRFTYELSSIGGFVDCLIVVETVNNTQNYIELNQVRQNMLSTQEKWSEVKSGDACEIYILNRIKLIFPQSINQSFVKGYVAKVQDGFNFTMFFISANEGIIPYIYTADVQELTVCKANSTQKIDTSKISNSVINETNKNQSKSKPTPVPTPTPILNPTPTPTPIPAPTPNNTIPKNESKTKSIENHTQNFISLQNLESNAVYSIGYAVIDQQYDISTFVVDALFYIQTSPIIYGIYLDNNITYLRFTFTINSTKGQFQIVSYSQSSNPYINMNPQTASNTSFANVTHNSTSNEFISTKSNTTQPIIVTNTTLLPANCGKTSTEYIDITSAQSKDIFLPRINLLLMTMYEYLSNSHIVSVKYNLGYEPSSVSKITYQITYENIQGSTYDFQVAIVNNQFQLIKSPNSTATASNTTTNPTQPSQPIEVKPNITQGNSTSKNTNSTMSNTKSQKSQKISITNATIPNKTNKSTPSDSQKEAITPEIPVINNHTQSFNKTKVNDILNNTSPIITEISPKNYTSEPKYKSLITILKSLYRIPPNTTVASMQTWEDNTGSSKYQIAFKMVYQVPLKDGSVAKISTYQLTVNPSSFVSVQSQRIDYIKAPPPPMPMPPEKPSLSLTMAFSPYLKTLFTILTTHSPQLASFTMQSLHLQAKNKTYGNNVAPFVEKLQFSKEKKILCFDVSYQLVLFESPGSKGSILNLIEYRLSDCSRPIFEENSFNLSSVLFSNQTKMNAIVNKHIQIFSSSPVAIDTYQTYQQFYRVRFTSMNTGEREVIIDSQSFTIFAYRTSPQTLYTSHRNTTLIDPSVVHTLQVQMQKIFKLQPGSLILQLIRKTNDDNQMWLIEIFGKTQIKSLWLQEIYQSLKMQALYYPQQSFLKIVNASALSITYTSFLLNSTAINWVEVPIEQTFTEQRFTHLVASLKATYSSFLDNSLLVSLYREYNSKYSTLGQYIGQKEGGRFQIVVSKQFTSNYHINYLLTVRYGALSNTTELQNLQSIDYSNLTIKDCLAHDNSSQIPRCSKCNQDYVLIDSICYPQIDGCEEYLSNMCAKCKSGFLASKNMQTCLTLEEKTDRVKDTLLIPKL